MRDSHSGEVEAACLSDHMRLALLMLGLCGQAERIVDVLRNGRSLLQPMVQGAAEAAVELCRMGLQSDLQRAGFIDAARTLSEELSKSRMDKDTARLLEALTFAEGWVSVHS